MVISLTACVMLENIFDEACFLQFYKLCSTIVTTTHYIETQKVPFKTDDMPQILDMLTCKVFIGEYT